MSNPMNKPRTPPADDKYRDGWDLIWNGKTIGVLTGEDAEHFEKALAESVPVDEEDYKRAEAIYQQIIGAGSGD